MSFDVPPLWVACVAGFVAAVLARFVLGVWRWYLIRQLFPKAKGVYLTAIARDMGLERMKGESDRALRKRLAEVLKNPSNRHGE